VPDPSLREPESLVRTPASWYFVRKAFNEWHVLAISQPFVCIVDIIRSMSFVAGHGYDIRSKAGSGHYIGSAGGKRCRSQVAEKDEYTPTPVISPCNSHYNHGRKKGLAEASLSPPRISTQFYGGLKYNPPMETAERSVTDWIEAKANEFLES